MECKELFLKSLPGLLDELNYKEKVILKMRYFKDIKISRISRMLGLTRKNKEDLN